MTEDHLVAAGRRIEELEARLASLRDAMRAAGEQGRFHLIATLGTLIDDTTKQIDEARRQIAKPNGT
jgi:hypothetical protein